MKKEFTFRLLLYSLLFFIGAGAALSRGGHAFLGLILAGCCIIRFFYFMLDLMKCRNPRQALLLKRIVSTVLCLFLLAAVVTGCFIGYTALGDPLQELDYIIVLGAGVNGTEPSLSLLDRLNAAATYLDEHPNTICIVSGGKGGGEKISEAECMSRYLTKYGISEQRILLEDQATTTAENISFSLNLLKTHNGYFPDKIGILSSEYHLFRAKMYAHPYKVTTYGIPAKSSVFSVKLNYFFREIAAVWYYSIVGGTQ